VKHIACFSGGKDSTALVLWAKENLPEFTAVFCDTGWEHPITYAYIEEVNQTVLGGSLVRIASDRYPGGFVELVQKKRRCPSAKARFCTEQLKVVPMIHWLDQQGDELTVYQGIRADESLSRSRMPARQWSDHYDAWIERPLLHWTAEQCFDLIRAKDVQPNPLYLMGAARVGCFPCVMVNMRELKAYLTHPQNGPALKQRLLDLEARVGRSFFEPTYIPERFCTGFDDVSGKPFPWCSDVFRYLESVDENQLPLLPARSCMSVYNLCE